MQQILDNEKQAIHYADIIQRVVAFIIDGAIVGIPVAALMFYNIFSVKSIALLVIANLLSMAYKPVMEGIYGATLGKMLMKTKVVDTNFEKPGWTPILLRNSLYIGLSVVGLIPTIMMFSEPGFENIDSFMGYSAFAAGQDKMYSGIITLIYLVDFLFMVIDKQHRSLHDRIGKTYVIDTTVAPAQFYQ